MNTFRQTGRTKYTAKIPVLRNGKVVWFNRPTGTVDGNTARKMGKMVAELGPEGLAANDILEAVVARRLTVSALWQLWQEAGLSPNQKVKAIRATLADVDLLTKRAGWLADVTMRSSANNAGRYDHALDTLLDALTPEGEDRIPTLPKSAVTVEALKGWLAGLTVKAGTKRRHLAGLSSFFAYCVSVGVLDRDPLADVEPPKLAKPRDRHLSAAEASALADAQASPFRELSATLAGSGLEVGVALALTVKDVDVRHQEIRARGKKNDHRDRIARVAAWAWPYVLRAIAGKLPNALVFDGVTQPDVRKSHLAACQALGITDYTNRDARHTFAVRMVKAGTPFVQVAKQMGHVDANMIGKVYGIYEPTEADRAHWEAVATARDAATDKEKQG